jgi:hypothetical protein
MMYLMVVVGGPGYFFGPLLGSAVGVMLPEWLRFAQAWYLFVFGTAVVLLMIWLPDGLLSIPDRLRAKAQAREASDAAALAAAAQGAGHDGPHHDRPAAPVLKVTGLKKAYGAIQAVGGVSFEVMPGRDLRRDRAQRLGQDHAVQQHAGPDHPDAGRIELNGEDVTGWARWSSTARASAAPSRRCRCSAR